MSIRIPFGLLLKVGGKRENIAKLIVKPDAAAPSVVMTKTLSVVSGVISEVSETKTCFQLVWSPETKTEAEAKTVPSEV